MNLDPAVARTYIAQSLDPLCYSKKAPITNQVTTHFFDTQDEPWSLFERVVLVHGVRCADELSYSGTIAALQRAHCDQFTFIPALSREQQNRMLRGRITALLNDGELEQHAGARIHPDNSHVMLCGNSEMIKDVRALLEQRGLQRHRRHAPGHYTTEQYH